MKDVLLANYTGGDLAIQQRGVLSNEVLGLELILGGKFAVL